MIVEDGSLIPCDTVVEKYIHDLDITYCVKENEGQGFARNYGYDQAKGDYYIVFDSDCIIPPHYLQEVNNYLDNDYLDAYGGPDKAHHSFSKIQKAINYSMTSLFTTGGTRSGKKRLAPYHPRSFNMGISPEVYSRTGGYSMPYKGEDIVFSIRIINSGFKTGFIKNAFVYHKRRTSWLSFFRQLHFFGTARINITRYFPDQLKFVHLFPLFFTLGILLMIILLPFYIYIAFSILMLYFLFALLLFFDSLLKNKDFTVAILSVFAGFIQLLAYGLGFLQEGFVKIFKG
jgi:cellulose synthase/poly-beta-1,6-N-acetylglucosamine synthase-like glycosyltransferase